VVERVVQAFELARREPLRLGGVVATFGATADRRGLVENRDVVAPRIAVRRGVDAEELSDAHLEPRLLERLARAAVLRPFLPVQKAAWQSPAALERRPSPPDEQEPSALVHDPGVHGHARYLLAPVKVLGGFALRHSSPRVVP
jgi:hypothetical protein